MDCIIIHYGEIAIKGKNRPWFERVLLENIRQRLKGLKYEKLKKISGRFLLVLNKDSQHEEILKRLQNIFGINSLSVAYQTKQNIKSMEKAVEKLVKQKQIQRDKSIRLVTKRSNKQFSMTSPEVNKQLGHYLVKNYNMTIDLVEPEQKVWVEIVDHSCFIYSKQMPGLQGLPVSVSGKVVTLLSGGIDSPVAAYYAMKRGCAVKFVHFFNDTINTKESLDKVKQLVKILAQYNKNTKLYLVPFKEIQYEIMKVVPKTYRMIIYKRFMMKLGEIIARKENAKALIVGDSVGQVSSQILPSLQVIRDDTKSLILSPLITQDKQEIVDKAKEIGTYDTSILPYGDCCSYMIAKHPVLDPKKNVVEKLEEQLPIKNLVLNAVKNAEIVRY